MLLFIGIFSGFSAFLYRLLKLELLQQHHKPSLYESIYRVFLGVIKQLLLCGVGIYYAVS